MTNGSEPITPISPSGCINQGLTKREYFAAMAMQGLLSLYDDKNGIFPNQENANYMAYLSVTSADALIESLNK